MDLSTLQDLKAIFPNHKEAVLRRVVDRNATAEDNGSSLTRCIDELVNLSPSREWDEDETISSPAAGNLSTIQEEVRKQLKPIFPHLTDAQLMTSVKHPSNTYQPLSVTILLQRCIDDLLEDRTAADSFFDIPELDKGSMFPSSCGKGVHCPELQHSSKDHSGDGEKIPVICNSRENHTKLVPGSALNQNNNNINKTSSFKVTVQFDTMSNSPASTTESNEPQDCTISIVAQHKQMDNSLKAAGASRAIKSEPSSFQSKQKLEKPADEVSVRHSNKDVHSKPLLSVSNLDNKKPTPPDMYSSIEFSDSDPEDSMETSLNENILDSDEDLPKISIKVRDRTSSPNVRLSYSGQNNPVKRQYVSPSKFGATNSKPSSLPASSQSCASIKTEPGFNKLYKNGSTVEVFSRPPSVFNIPGLQVGQNSLSKPSVMNLKPSGMSEASSVNAKVPIQTEQSKPLKGTDTKSCTVVTESPVIDVVGSASSPVRPSSVTAGSARQNKNNDFMLASKMLAEIGNATITAATNAHKSADATPVPTRESIDLKHAGINKNISQNVTAARQSYDQLSRSSTFPPHSSPYGSVGASISSSVGLGCSSKVENIGLTTYRSVGAAATSSIASTSSSSRVGNPRVATYGSVGASTSTTASTSSSSRKGHLSGDIGDTSPMSPLRPPILKLPADILSTRVLSSTSNMPASQSSAKISSASIASTSSYPSRAPGPKPTVSISNTEIPGFSSLSTSTRSTMPSKPHMSTILKPPTLIIGKNGKKRVPFEDECGYATSTQPSASNVGEQSRLTTPPSVTNVGQHSRLLPPPSATNVVQQSRLTSPPFVSNVSQQSRLTPPSATNVVQQSRLTASPSVSNVGQQSRLSTSPSVSNVGQQSRLTTSPSVSNVVQQSKLTTLPSVSNVVQQSRLTTPPSVSNVGQQSRLTTTPSATNAAQQPRLTTMPSATNAAQQPRLTTLPSATNAAHQPRLTTPSATNVGQQPRLTPSSSATNVGQQPRLTPTSVTVDSRYGYAIPMPPPLPTDANIGQPLKHPTVPVSRPLLKPPTLAYGMNTTVRMAQPEPTPHGATNNITEAITINNTAGNKASNIIEIGDDSSNDSVSSTDIFTLDDAEIVLDDTLEEIVYGGREAQRNFVIDDVPYMDLTRQPPFGHADRMETLPHHRKSHKKHKKKKKKQHRRDTLPVPLIDIGEQGRAQDLPAWPDMTVPFLDDGEWGRFPDLPAWPNMAAPTFDIGGRGRAPDQTAGHMVDQFTDVEQTLKDVKTELLGLFPDIDPDHVDHLCLMHTGPMALNTICNILLESSYPKKKPVSPAVPSATATCSSFESKEDSIDYFKDYKSVRVADSNWNRYVLQVGRLLNNEFGWMSSKDINTIMLQFDHYYAPSYQQLTSIWRQAVEQVKNGQKKNGTQLRLSNFEFEATITIGTQTKILKLKLLKHKRTYRPITGMVVPELMKELNFVKTKLAEFEQEADLEMAKQLNEQEYEDEGQCIECGCCYGEYPFDSMVQCSDGHLFCQNCLQQYAKEAVFGQGKTDLQCMTDMCECSFPKSQLEKALPSDVLARYEDRIQEDNLNLAELGGLVRCPHCDFQAVLDDDNKVFTCVRCNKATCRHCKVDWEEHFGKRCEEVEKKDETKIRLAYEERMTQAKVRTCHKCKAQFTKEDGCNKMTCRCGAKMCYICRKPNINYDHFCRHPRDPGKTCTSCKACSLWTNPEEDDDRAVREIQKQANEARKEQGYTDDRLIGVPDEPPKKKLKKT